MTMLDDDRLSSLLGTAGAAFEVPESGPDDILARALGSPSDALAGADDGKDDEAGDRGDGTGPGGTAPAPGLRPHRARRVVAGARRHRLLSVAACVVVLLLVAGTIGALVSGPTARPPITTAFSPPRGAHAPANPVTTTVPPPSAGASVPAGGSAAPTFSANSKDQAGIAGTSAAAQNSSALPKGVVGQSAKIEQTGTLGLSVGRRDLTRAMAQLGALAGTDGGFVANSQTQSGSGLGGPPLGTVTLQVPVDNFSAALKQAQRIGRTTSLTTKATDVTGQYVDLQSRIAALDASRQQYLTIMTQATTVGDVLAVQAQLDTIESQLEQLQGQLQVLTSETSYSTLTANVSEGSPPSPPSPLPESGMVQAWHESVGGFLAGVEGVVRVAGPVLFALLCLAAALVGGRVLWRRFQRHRL